MYICLELDWTEQNLLYIQLMSKNEILWCKRLSPIVDRHQRFGETDEIKLCLMSWHKLETNDYISLGVLTLNRPGFSDDPEAGGGRKYVTFVFVVLDCNFYANHSFMVSNENFDLY